MENVSTPCPKHPSAPATFTCARCGTFACETCRSPADGTLCADCGTRYAAVSLSVGDTFQESFQFVLQHPRAPLVYMGAQVLFGLLTLPLTLRLQQTPEPGENPFAVLIGKWPTLLGLMVGGTLFAGVAYSLYIRYLGDVLEGRERPLGEMVEEGLGRVPAMIGTSILLSLAIGMGMMLCFAPGIFLAVALGLALPAVVLQPAGPFDALTLSWDRTQGHRVNLFLLMLLSGLILVAMGAVNGVAALALGALGTVGVVISTVVGQAASAAGAVFMLTTLVFCYLRLSGRWIPGSSAR